MPPPISPFFLFKDPSDIQWSGTQRLTGNQLRGFGDFGFDPNISIGDIIPGASQPGTAYQAPGTRGIFQDGIQIGSTSERNVIETPGGPGGEGFSLFTSTAANGQAVDALPETVVSVADDEGALPAAKSAGVLPVDYELDTADDDDAAAADDGTVFTPTTGIGAQWDPDWFEDQAPWQSPVDYLYNPWFTDLDLRSFTEHHFGSREYFALYGGRPGRAFRNLGTDPVVQMLVQRWKYPDRDVPRPSAKQMQELTTKFMQEMLRIRGESENIETEIVQSVTGSTPAGHQDSIFMTNLYGMPPELLNMFAELPGTIGTDILANLGGLGADILGGLDIPELASDIGTGIRGAIDPLTGADFGLDVIERDIFGEGGLEEKLRGLGLGELAAAIGTQGGRLNELANQLRLGMKFPTGFVETAGTLADQLGGMTDDLGVLGASPVPNALFRNLQRSQGLLDDIIGGSFGGEGYGFPAQRTGLAKALGQGEDLETLLGGLPAPPDLSLTGGPLDQARLLNELFTLGEGQLEGLGEDVGALRRGAVTDLSDDLERLGLGGLEGKIGSFLGEGGTFKNLEGLLGGLGLGIDDLLPSRELLREQLAYRAPRLTAAQVLPDEGILDEAWTAMRPEQLTTGDLLPDEGILDAAWTGMRPVPLTLDDLLPTEGQLTTAWDERKPVGLGVEGLLPGKDELDRAWALRRPTRLTAGDLLPGDLTERWDEMRPSPLTIDDLGLDPLNALLDRLDLGGLDPLGRLEDSSAYVGPLNDLLAGIQAGDFGRLPDLLANAGVDINLPGLDRIETLLGPLSLLPGMGGQVQGLADTMPGELSKIIELLGPEGLGRGGGVTDISGLEDSLADILARLDTADGLQPSGAGGVFEELLDAIRGDFDRPTTAEELRADPITASILADQEEQDRLREREDRELLQRFGVLRGGQTIDLANLRADDQSRAVLAALGQGAERAEARFTGAIGAGTDIAGLLERRELARAGELGWMDGERTLAGQDQDAALLSAIFTMLQSEFNPLTTADQQQVDLVRSLLPLLPPDMRQTLEEMFEGAGFATPNTRNRDRWR